MILLYLKVFVCKCVLCNIWFVFVFGICFCNFLLQAPSVHMVDNMQHLHLDSKLTRVCKAGCVLCFKREGHLRFWAARKAPLEHMGKYIWSPSNIWFEVFVFVSRWPVIWFGLIWSILPIFDSYLEQIPNLFDIWMLYCW